MSITYDLMTNTIYTYVHSNVVTRHVVVTIRRRACPLGFWMLLNTFSWLPDFQLELPKFHQKLPFFKAKLFALACVAAYKKAIRFFYVVHPKDLSLSTQFHIKYQSTIFKMFMPLTLRMDINWWYYHMISFTYWLDQQFIICKYLGLWITSFFYLY